jgi:hypothetical protein
MRNKFVFIGVSIINSYRDIEGNANLHFSRKKVFPIMKTAVPGEQSGLIFLKIFLKYKNM